MNHDPEAPASTLDRIRRNLVGLKMPRALEVLEATVRQIERGEISALDAIDALLAEELTLRQNRRMKMALMTARITAVKTLAAFDFAFQPSLDRNRVLALAALGISAYPRKSRCGTVPCASPYRPHQLVGVTWQRHGSWRTPPPVPGVSPRLRGFRWRARTSSEPRPMPDRPGSAP